RLAALVDYGPLGESRRFEAWQCGPPWRGLPETATQTACASSAYLCACGLTDGDRTAADVHECHGRAVLIPDPAAGYCNDSILGAKRARAVGALRLNNCGISLIQRSVEAVFADLFASVSGSR